MKILILTDSTISGAGARTYCFQLKAPLENLGHKVNIGAPSSEEQYQRFMQNPCLQGLKLKRVFFNRLKRYLYWNGIVFPNRISQIISARYYDIVVLFRNLWHLESDPWLERLLQKIHSRIVYCIDDALHVYWPHYMHYRYRSAVHVWAGSEYIANYVKQFNPKVTVIEPGFDMKYYLPKSSYQENQPLVIGWTGTTPSFRDLRLLDKPLSRLQQEYSIIVRVVSSEPFSFGKSGIHVQNIKWTLSSEISNLQSFDIGVMPVVNDEYGRGKAGFKLKQYMACGLPSVASPVGVNKTIIKHGHNGFLASSEEEWYEILKQLILDHSLREKIGIAGRSYIIQNHSLTKMVRQVEALFYDIIREGQTE